MIVDALLEAEPHMKIAERIFDPKRFVWLTDGILTEIQASTSPVSTSFPFVSSLVEIEIMVYVSSGTC